jgi:hypothetical protein
MSWSNTASSAHASPAHSTTAPQPRLAYSPASPGSGTAEVTQFSVVMTAVRESTTRYLAWWNA